MPTPEQHAKLSASSAHRWLNCPPSVQLSEQFPSKTSTYAEAGRLAHAIAELKARKYFLEPMSARTYNAHLKKLQADPYYEKAMDKNTDIYLGVLKETALAFPEHPFVALETRVDFSDYVPGGFGTTDSLMISGDTMVIIDYKNGAGVPVEAEENPQMQLYGLGALQTYGPIFGDSIRKVILQIVQPNAGGTKSWETTVEDLRHWAETTVRPAAQDAIAGDGNFRAGDWCKFCPAKAQCSARARQMLSLEPMVGAVPEKSLTLEDIADRQDKGLAVPPLLTDEEVGGVLRRARTLAAWVKDLEEYALTASLEGREISGFKAVEGRGSRDWVDPDEAFAILQSRGIDESLLYERKPVSVAGLEKSLGKAAFKEAAKDLWIKKPGKPALAPDTDKRPAYNAAAVAFGGSDA